MTDDGFDEYDLYEAQYADQFDVLNELEGKSSFECLIYKVLAVFLNNLIK